MDKEPTLENSPLSQRMSVDGKEVDIQIYRIVGEPGWALEAVDDYGNSTCWDGLFKTDAEALAMVQGTIESEGIDALIGEPSHGMH